MSDRSFEDFPAAEIKRVRDDAFELAEKTFDARYPVPTEIDYQPLFDRIPTTPFPEETSLRMKEAIIGGLRSGVWVNLDKCNPELPQNIHRDMRDVFAYIVADRAEDYYKYGPDSIPMPEKIPEPEF